MAKVEGYGGGERVWHRQKDLTKVRYGCTISEVGWLGR